MSETGLVTKTLKQIPISKHHVQINERDFAICFHLLALLMQLYFYKKDLIQQIHCIGSSAVGNSEAHKHAKTKNIQTNTFFHFFL